MATVQQKLLTMWSDILGRPDIQTADEFSELGGTSLHLLRVLGGIKAEFGVTVFHCDLPARVTIDSLAHAIERRRWGGSVESEVRFDVVRIYFNKFYLPPPSGGFWRRVTRVKRPAASWLASEALRSGVDFAVVTVGAAGFVRGATRVEFSFPEITPEKWPTCLELVGRPASMTRLLESHREVLCDALVLRVQGHAVLNSPGRTAEDPPAPPTATDAAKIASGAH